MNKEKIDKEAKKLKKLEEKALKKSKGFWSEFRAFATKGNVIDMAVGVVIASAFTAIVNSLVKDIITPLISLLTGKIDFTNLFIALDGNKYATLAEAEEKGGSILKYGNFITAIINFLLIALCIFIFLKVVFKVINIKKKEVEEVKKTKICPYCKSEINIEASRCPHCTSVLEEENNKE